MSDDIQSSIIDDSTDLIPVNPVIEDYMRSLMGQTDHAVLMEMEEFGRQRDFPIVNRLVGVFLKLRRK